MWALPERPLEIDPLLARGASEQLVSRQIHEPLAENVGAPFEEARREPGLARSVTASTDATVWRVRLREGIRFQDGSPLNAAAVLANAERWRESGLMPGALADGPRPDLVRFILPASDPEFDRLLARPELGVVSRRALRRSSATSAFPLQLRGTGTGPFELREWEAERVLLARNTDWWGSDAGLGPALDQLEFRAEPLASERLALLEDGTAHVASGVDPGRRGISRQDPLLEAIGGPASLVAERSVRGIDAADGRAPMLNDVWLTGIGPG